MDKKKQKKNYSAPKCEIVLVSENTNLRPLQKSFYT